MQAVERAKRRAADVKDVKMEEAETPIPLRVEQLTPLISRTREDSEISNFSSDSDYAMDDSPLLIMPPDTPPPLPSQTPSSEFAACLNHILETHILDVIPPEPLSPIILLQQDRARRLAAGEPEPGSDEQLQKLLLQIPDCVSRGNSILLSKPNPFSTVDPVQVYSVHVDITPFEAELTSNLPLNYNRTPTPFPSIQQTLNHTDDIDFHPPLPPLC